jgi:release factor glutamine methyltransferase
VLTIQNALQQGTRLLEDAGVAAPRLTAEVLLGHALHRERVWLFAHSTDELPEVAWIHYGRYLHERLSGKPTQYITRTQEFFGRAFKVNSDVLIPRPETEHVIERALALLPRPRRVLDIGTGSGAIAITLVLELGAAVVATDISPAALAVARSNAAALEAPVSFVCCDLAAALAGPFDLVVSNPPYVPASDLPGLQREVRDHEPQVALLGGLSGVELYLRIIPQAARLLRPGGSLIFEIGYRSEPAVRPAFDGLWRDVTLDTDLAGLPRVLSARYAPE